MLDKACRYRRHCWSMKVFSILSEGLLILVFEKKYPNFKEGAYGTVFFTSDDRATKVFKRRNDAPPSHTNDVYESEVKAYELATSNTEIIKFIPQFYGHVLVTKIVNDTDQDISNEYELSLAYQMQKIDGDFIKKSCLSTEIGKLFLKIGISHLSDTSVILDSTGNICWVIDFAVQEHILEHPSFY